MFFLIDLAVGPLFVEVSYCSCQTLNQVLVRHGFFPTAPDQLCAAVSIELLDLYNGLFDRPGDTLDTVAGALDAFYRRRGFSFDFLNLQVHFN